MYHLENAIENVGVIDIARDYINDVQLRMWNDFRYKPKLRYYNLYKAEVRSQCYITANL